VDGDIPGLARAIERLADAWVEHSREKSRRTAMISGAVVVGIAGILATIVWGLP
jgi:predicted nucleic acid-binding protein